MSEFVFLTAWSAFTILSVWACRRLAKRTGFFSPAFIFVLVFSLQLAIYPIAWRLLDSNDFASLLGTGGDKLERDAAILLIAAVALCCFLAGLRGTRLKQPARTWLRNASVAVQRKALIGIGVIIFILSYLQLFLFIGVFGPGVFALAELGAYRSGGFAGSGNYTYPVLHAVPMCFVLILCSLLDGSRLSLRARAGLTIAGVLVVLPPLVLGFRIYVVMSLFMILPAIHYFHRSINIKKLVMLGLLVLAAFAAYGYARELVERDFAGIEREVSFVEEILSPLTRTKATDIVDFVLRSRTAPEWFGLLIPEMLSSAIPRELRPDFPIATVRFGENVMADYLYLRSGLDLANFGGITPTLLGFALWQGGLVSAFLLLFLAGKLSRWLARALQAHPASPFRRAYLVLVFASLVNAIEAPQDALNGFFIRCVVLGVLFVIVMMFCALYHGVRREAPPQRTEVV